jgi:hypothetical protein
MKKLPILLLCLMLALTACSGNAEQKETSTDAESTVARTFNASDFENYVGDGQMEIFRTLIDAHGYFVSEVFYAKTLPADESAAFEKDGVKYVPVKSDKFRSYSDLTASVGSVYSADTAKKILAQYPAYADIDGKLCIVKGKSTKEYGVDWSNCTLTVKEAGNDKCVINVTVKNGDKDITIPVTFINQTGNWRLDGFYTAV